MIISQRTKQILKYLLETNDPLSVPDLAKLLGVTTRTIYRQLPEVTDVIDAHHLTLEHSDNYGMIIVGSLYHMKELESALEHSPSEYTFKSTERVDLIILQLLHANDYVKTQNFAIDLHTSTQSIRNDYQMLKQKVLVHGITFETKKSEGVRLIGKEIAKRHLFANILLEHISTGAFFDWLRGATTSTNPFIAFLTGIDYQEALITLYEHISPMIERRHMNISDKEYQEFLLLICIFIKRHNDASKESLTPEGNIPEGEADLYQELLGMLDTVFDIQLVDSEADYFHWMIHLYAGRDHYKTYNQSIADENFDQIQQLIDQVTQDFDFPFNEDKNLGKNLMLHTVMALERIQSGIVTSNPMLKEIQQSNPTLYKIVKTRFLEIFHGIDIPEDEIGYIAIYFLASMDYLSKQSLSVLVVCSTGIGSAKMLRSRLEREFGEITVKKTISLHKVSEENLADYDFIVSTVPLDIERDRYVCVSPLLNDKDKEEARKYIQNIHKNLR